MSSIFCALSQCCFARLRERSDTLSRQYGKWYQDARATHMCAFFGGLLYHRYMDVCIWTAHLYHINGREIARGFKGWRLSVTVVAVGHDTEGRIFAGCPSTSKILKSLDQLRYLPHDCFARQTSLWISLAGDCGWIRLLQGVQYYHKHIMMRWSYFRRSISTQKVLLPGINIFQEHSTALIVFSCACCRGACV